MNLDQSAGVGSGSGFSFGFSSSSLPSSIVGTTRPVTGGFSFGAPSTPNKKDKKHCVVSTSVLEGIDIISSEAKIARNAFDTIDVDKAGELMIDEQLDALLDEIGEGYHGDELDKQIVLLDPETTGLVRRDAFIRWYCQLVKGDVDKDEDDHGSLDTEEQQERDDEKAKAKDAFESVVEGGKDFIPKAEFPKLIEEMGTTYCEEEHRRTIKKISDDSGNINKESFIEWYMEWLFGNGDDSDSEDGYESDGGGEGDAGESDNTSTGDRHKDTVSASSGGWGSTFKVDEGSWKCESCMMQNKSSAYACPACETTRPGYEDKVTAEEGDATTSTKPPAFTFSAAGASTPKSAVGVATPCSFGGAVSQGSSDALGKGGFSFGGSSGSNKPLVGKAAQGGMNLDQSAGVGSGSGFSFGFSSSSLPSSIVGTTRPVAGGFSFGAPSTPNEKDGNSILSKDKSMLTNDPAPSSSFTTSKNSATTSGGYPPLASKAPTPFGLSDVSNETKDRKSSTSTSTSGGYPPLASKAPTPFGPPMTTKQTKPEKASLGSSYPPMSHTAPKPFGEKAVSKSSTSASQSSPFGGYPPIASKAPTPFGSSLTPNPTTSSVGSSASSYPPMSQAAPKPFGEGVTSKSSTSAQLRLSSVTDKKYPANRNIEYNASSQYEVQLWRIVQSFLIMLDNLEPKDRNVEDQNVATKANLFGLNKSIDNVLGEAEKVRSTAILLDEVVNDQLQLAIFLLSRSDDIARQLKESKEIINRQQADAWELDVADLSKDQPLDLESEKARRRLAHRTVIAQGVITRVREKIRLIEGTSTLCISKNSATIGWPNIGSRSLGRLPKSLDFEATKVLFDSLKKGYDRTKLLSSCAVNLNEKASDMIKSCEHKKLVTNHVNTKKCGKGMKSKIIPFPFLSPTLSEKKTSRVQLKEGHMSLPCALRKLTRTLSDINVKRFPRSSLSLVHTTDKVALPQRHSLRSSGGSLLMNANESIGVRSHQVPHTTMGYLNNRSPPSVRRGWTTDCNIDGKEVEHMTLPLPSALKQIDVKRAERKALCAFGTTPERIIEAQDRRQRVKNNTTVPSSSFTTSKNSATTSGGYPPLASKAPTPFGLSDVSNETKDRKSSTSTSTSGGYPPLASKAPTPFGPPMTTKQTKPARSLSGKSESKRPSNSMSSSVANAKKNVDSVGESSSALLESRSESLNNKGTPLNQQSTDERQPTDYHQIMTQFYQKNNAAKLSEVTATLQKYKGREIRLFEKLAKIYKVPNPLKDATKESEHVAVNNERNPIGAQQAHQNIGKVDYHTVLTKFYQTYNPAKVGEVAKTLHKYKGLEPKMFAKLAQKYHALNPLVQSMDHSASTLSESNNNSLSTDQTLTPALASSPFGPTKINSQPMRSSFGSSSSLNVSSFGGTSNTAFGNTSTPTKNPFGTSSTQTSTASFGFESNTKTAFGLSPVPVSNPFGVNPTPSAIGVSSNFAGQSPASTSFGVNPPSTAISASSNFAQKSARELLLAFYQQSNPTKVSEVDKLLVKYAGKEEQMFRNLAKKYNVDPTLFGLKSAASSFGQSGGLGSPVPFGHTSGSSVSNAGSFGSGPQGGFGSFAQPSHATAGGFASLAATSPTPTANTGGFSSFSAASPTPFGAARR